MNNVVYEEFINCQKHTLDKYWIDLLYRCACNKFPKGVKYDGQKNIIYVKHEKTKAENFNIPLNDTKKMYDLLVYIFRDLLDIRSEYDINISKKELEECRKLNNIDMNTDWKRLKPKSVKNTILMNFVVNKINEKSIDQKKIKKTYNQLQLAFQFKRLTNDDVEYENGTITDIKGFNYNEHNKEFEIQSIRNPCYRSEKQVNKTTLYQQHIDRWIKDYKSICFHLKT